MSTWIAFFRGVNVGGNNALPMKKLVTVLEKAGLSDVRTYIQSGNIVFKSASKNAEKLAELIGGCIGREFGFQPRVMVLTPRELERAAAANPFSDADANPKSVHLVFLEKAPARPDLASLDKLKIKGEGFALKEKVLYLHTPEGIHKSKLAERSGRLLGVEGTSRNWRTVCTVLELAKSAQ